ncbi:potassium:proton antiporter [Klebsiella variicola]|uniref:potassium:proton antiporter n=1 Tax=Klebsiella variicola TaxID=244366 RepID=UPI00109D484F|nr:potassium:proton antiporter [Klebsiella variicola]
MSNSSVLLALSLFVQDASLKYATKNNLSEAQNYMQLWRQNGEKKDVKSSLKIYLMMELLLNAVVLMANSRAIFRFT